jgi:hypothetical protein
VTSIVVDSIRLGTLSTLFTPPVKLSSMKQSRGRTMREPNHALKAIAIRLQKRGLWANLGDGGVDDSVLVGFRRCSVVTVYPPSDAVESMLTC